MFFVETRYHRDPARAGGRVRYIAHREEGRTDGHRRELYGIGERYRAFRGDEKAIRKALRDDGRGLRNPAYFRFILTVDNPTAERFKRFDGHLSERVLRDAAMPSRRLSVTRLGEPRACLPSISTVGRIARPTLTSMLS
jgi:hypothetical protein